MEKAIQYIVKFYDKIHLLWESPKTHSRLATLLVLSFLISLGMSLILYLGIVPENLIYLFPKNIFQSIQEYYYNRIIWRYCLIFSLGVSMRKTGGIAVQTVIKQYSKFDLYYLVAPIHWKYFLR